MHGVIIVILIISLALRLDHYNQGGGSNEIYNAAILLPDELVKELQEYIQGGYIYVPAIHEQRKCWGELSGYRKELIQRNSRIVEEYKNGISIEELADRYYLSIHAIRK